MVETPLKSAALFLSGLAATLAGAFMRSCHTGLPAELSSSWCGAPALQLVARAHEHCAGCVIFAAGIGLIALSSAFVLESRATPPARAR